MDEFMNLLALRDLEEAENNFRPNNVHNPRNPLVELNAKQFIKMFRLSKELFGVLQELLEPYLVPQRRVTDLDIRTKILAALKFLASGSYQPEVGSNKFIDISQSSVSKCVQEVVEALNNPEIFMQWVHFPRTIQELDIIRQRFYEEHGFPGVIGCIDCTHVAIVPPPSNDPEYPEHIYVNRKNYHSINVQLICDSRLKIMNVNAKYPGSTNDAYIWTNSSVEPVLQNLHRQGYTDYFLLGDSGYPLRTWIMTPFNEVQPNTPEALYNELHKRTRVKIECCNGLLKARFRCLLKHRVLHYHPLTASKICNACVVLHNMCIEYNVPHDDDEEIQELDLGLLNGGNMDNAEDAVNDRADRINPQLAHGRRSRQHLVNVIARRH